MSSDTHIRDQLEQCFKALVLGPLESGEIIESSPSDTYLTGVLWPRGTSLGAEEDDGGTGGPGDDEGGMDVPVPGYRAIRPCSVGITFSVRKGVAFRILLGTTARYFPEDGPPAQSDSLVADRGGKRKRSEESGSAKSADFADGDDAPSERNRLQWRREQLNYSIVVDANESRGTWRTSDFLLPDGKRITDSNVCVDIKRREFPDGHVVTVTLINEYPEIREGPRDASCLFQAMIRVETDGKLPQIMARQQFFNADDDDARMNALLYRNAREFAIGHGVATDWADGPHESVSWVSTNWIPHASVKGTSPDGHESIRVLQQGGHNPFGASRLGDDSAKTETLRVLTALCRIYGDWIKDTLRSRLGDFQGEQARAAERSIEQCVRTHTRMMQGVETLRSSPEAWRAFVLSNRAMNMQAQFRSKGDRAGPLIWRPFQIAFMLVVLSGIVDKRDPGRETMDLLWFPTGGGKTEAYLALTAFTIFYRRLIVETSRETEGVDVLMRYTLRLLTVQQFQRAAALICACEAIQREEGPAVLGNAPIRLGLYVGNDTTPNKLEAAEIAIADERNGQRPTSTPRQLLNCPVCGTVLGPECYTVQAQRHRVGIRCPEISCSTYGHDLPVQTVDELIYHSPPSLLIGTIDKFAQLPRNESLGTLFGLGNPIGPDLIIQDELHLISGPLGSVAGLYETAVDLLCAREGVRPKVIGSTATIGRAERQVRALFDRDVLQFPPAGFDASDSFFAVQNEDDRRYLGVSSAGRSPKFALQAVLGTLMQLIAASLESHPGSETESDPYWTCVAYFNSLRELGGAIVMMQDDVPRTMRFIAGRLGGAVRSLKPPEELTSRVPSNRIPVVLNELGIALDGDVMSGEPVDSVLASNMISVGVDIPRLGLMVVNGQPKSTAEYIQATSRVGRRSPGLVVTVYNSGRPRDESHFEHFRTYHDALYRAVEATSVTPWAPRARDKALHAVVAALVRHLVRGLGDDEGAVEFDAEHPVVESILKGIAARAKRGSFGLEEKETGRDLWAIVRRWSRIAAKNKAAGLRLRYWEKPAPFGRTAPHLMRDAEKMKRTETIAWPTPNSMREIEPSTVFVMKKFATAVRSSEDNGAT